MLDDWLKDWVTIERRDSVAYSMIASARRGGDGAKGTAGQALSEGVCDWLSV